SLELSAQGRRVFEHTRRMFQESERLINDLRTPDFGEELLLTVGIVPHTTAPFMAHVFMPLLKDLKLRPRLVFGEHDSLMKRILREELELVITDTSPHGPAGNHIQK